jgi:hypothetical protein
MRITAELLSGDDRSRTVTRCLPDAFPMCFVSRNPTVTAMQSTMSSQLISGMYIWPWILSDVCTTFTLGKQLRDRLWLIMENVPLIIAWLPTTDAKIASTSTGHLIDSAIQNQKNGVKL